MRFTIRRAGQWATPEESPWPGATRDVYRYQTKHDSPQDVEEAYWWIEVETLEELVTMATSVRDEPIIIHRPDWEDHGPPDMPGLLIYDSYIE